MPWQFQISTGKLSLNGEEIAHGYSGYGDAANDPKRIKEKAIGPIPPGKYKIGGGFKHDKLGPVAMRLEPFPDNEMYGRSAFLLHGDNSTPAPHDGSQGCLIFPRPIRERVNFSTDKILEVVP